jgi:polysaccharide biosynthesis transport protein
VSVPERYEAFRESDNLSSLMVLLRRRWPLIVGIVAACLVVAVVRHERSAKSYTATASVAFQSATLPDAALQVSPSGSSEPQRAADTEVYIAHSSEVAEGVRKQLRLSTSAKELLELVKVEAAANADILNIIASTGNAQYSARLANAFAKQYIAFKAAAQVASIEEAQRQLQQQIAALPAGSASRASLEESQQRIGGLRAVTGGGANVISLATPPTAPSGVSSSTTALIGILIGLALAFSLVFLLESLDRRIKTIEDFERDYRLPALAGVPQSAFDSGSADERTAQLEPYRILRSALDFAAVARPLHTLLITSAVSGEGKTTVAVDLAHAIALTGRNVVLAEFDLRRPMFGRHFNLSSHDGLTTALARGEHVSDLLVKPFPELPNLSLLRSGQLPPNPSELLGTAAVQDIISELADGETTVIIDAPPLNPVADAQVLLSNSAVSGVIVVGRVDKTTREEVRRARAILDHHTVVPIGLVVTGLRDAGRYGYEPYEAIGPALQSDVGALARPPSRSATRRPVT